MSTWEERMSQRAKARMVITKKGKDEAMNEDDCGLLALFGAPCETQKIKDHEFPVSLKLSAALLQGRIVTKEEAIEACAEPWDEVRGGVRTESITWDGKRLAVTRDDVWL